MSPAHNDVWILGNSQNLRKQKIRKKNKFANYLMVSILIYDETVIYCACWSWLIDLAIVSGFCVDRVFPLNNFRTLHCCIDLNCSILWKLLYSKRLFRRIIHSTKKCHYYDLWVSLIVDRHFCTCFALTSSSDFNETFSIRELNDQLFRNVTKKNTPASILAIKMLIYFAVDNHELNVKIFYLFCWFLDFVENLSLSPKGHWIT